MLNEANYTTMGVLAILSIIMIAILQYIKRQKIKSQLKNIFEIMFRLIIFWMLGLVMQIFCINNFENINPVYFDYFIDISICFLPVAFLFMSLIFVRTKIEFKPKYILLFIVPIITLLVVWTNDFHHWFYKKYSVDFRNTEYGFYINIHNFYTYALYAVSLFILIKYSIKNSSFFSKQVVLILIGTLAPIIPNILAITGILPISIYVIPITFAVAIVCFSLGMFKYDLLKVTPIALQRIVDRISDSYIIINEEHIITDFNETLTKIFDIEEKNSIRGKSLRSFLLTKKLDESNFNECIDRVKNNDETESFELYVENLEKHFNIEISSIYSNNQFLGTLILFKDITQHINDMKKIKDTQESLMESERLSSLGQLIGGIAHNLKTPIMSVSGAAEGLRELINEYDKSIDSPQVTSSDHHEIAREMDEWVKKIKSYTEYMSDIITAVRGQAVSLSATENVSFDIDNLIKRVTILMNHELKSAQINMNTNIKVPENTTINGDINSLVQVINNMITNAIQSYDGKIDESIDLVVDKKENDLIISIIDHGCGLPENVKDKLFKEMITTKGKNGTGLGMYMSYSTVKANFNGTITFESEPGKGTTFNIIIPV